MEITIHEIAPPLPDARRATGRHRSPARLAVEALQPGQAVTFSGLPPKAARLIQHTTHNLNRDADMRLFTSRISDDKTEITVWRLVEPEPIRQYAPRKPAAKAAPKRSA